MPYLRITAPALPADRRQMVASRLTDVVVELFFDPRSRTSKTELRLHTTVHFTPYGPQELFIGGVDPLTRPVPDVTVELSDWYLSIRRQRKIARLLTPVLAELFMIPATELDSVNIRFHSYPPTQFAVGGRLLADLIPQLGQLARRFLG